MKSPVTVKLDMRKSFEYLGESGKSYRFDLAAFRNDDLALVEAVVPYQNLIAAKYMAFADTETRSGLFKYAIYERDLSQEDRALLSNVADVVSFTSFVKAGGDVIFF